jgi:hypothetical protein
MKPGTAKALREVSALTAPICRGCRGKPGAPQYGCCDRFFCSVAAGCMESSAPFGTKARAYFASVEAKEPAP